mmetsp:Transcript_2186/g.3163  ORF Transcript_2186/g.3163 Transcript_2186/m.3163 type:complete len:1246 (+) Transcript_2186:65-3802(+)
MNIRKIVRPYKNIHSLGGGGGKINMNRQLKFEKKHIQQHTPLININNHNIRKRYRTSQKIKGKERKQEYQKLTPREHVLARPDTYVGSTIPEEHQTYIIEKDEENNTIRVVKETLYYSAALYRICDELLQNAVDNHLRGRTKTIEVSINETTLTVKNDGETIPIEKQDNEAPYYIPELCFGHLLTSSNFDDEEERYTGGRNGYGAKLANIFSHSFAIEVDDGKQCYQQAWKEHMAVQEPYKIESSKSKKGYLKVELKPDFSLMGTTSFDSDFQQMIKRRLYDFAACNPKLKVKLDGETLELNDFESYIKEGFLYDESNPQLVKCNPTKDLEFVIAPHTNYNKESIRYSFVNSIATIRGGTHERSLIRYMTQAIQKHILENNPTLSKKYLTPNVIGQYFSLFINLKAINPTFDSQTKETYTTPFRLPQELNQPAFLKKFVKQLETETVIIQSIIDHVLKISSKVALNAPPVTKNKLDIPKLDDANFAGTKKSSTCTLIITEGDSAKSLAIAGLSVVGRDTYGVYPLRGKPLNVRAANAKAISKNEEIQQLMKIIGLHQHVDYSKDEAFQKLRYGSIMLMCDQDYDGSHIKGLVISNIAHFWPELLQRDFIKIFRTPLIKVTYRLSKQSKKETQSFYTIESFKEFVNSHSPIITSQKYYKGLGTNTSAEAKSYFKAINQHTQTLHIDKTSFKELNKVFDKSQEAVNERKDWLFAFAALTPEAVEKETSMASSSTEIDYTTFVNHELIHYAQYSNIRAIPHLMDGLKPSQRKILWGCFKKGLWKNEIKVAQLSGYISENAAYHHGEMSLQKAIIAMAQDYVGSNNLPLLEPIGQFGTRLAGGADAASARYIFTKLNPLVRSLFHPMDEHIVPHQVDDGKPVEPIFFAPILPLILINGADGIGTGFSTSIPTCSVDDVVTAIQTMLLDLQEVIHEEDSDDQQYELIMNAFSNYAFEEIHPAFSQFLGDVETNGKQKYKTNGVLEFVNPNADIPNIVDIIELPVRVWVDKYKEFLMKMRRDKMSQIKLSRFLEYHTDTQVHFRLYLTPDSVTLFLQKCERDGITDREKQLALLRNHLMKEFKLSRNFSTSNILLWNANGSLHHYDSFSTILTEFSVQRLKLYLERKKYMLDAFSKTLTELSEKHRFLDAISKGELDVIHTTDEELVTTLFELGFIPADGATSIESLSKTAYDHLTRHLNIRSLNTSQRKELSKKIEAQKAEMETLERQSILSLWRQDLDEFMIKYNKLQK